MGFGGGLEGGLEGGGAGLGMDRVCCGCGLHFVR